MIRTAAIPLFLLLLVLDAAVVESAPPLGLSVLCDAVPQQVFPNAEHPHPGRHNEVGNQFGGLPTDDPRRSHGGEGGGSHGGGGGGGHYHHPPGFDIPQPDGCERFGVVEFTSHCDMYKKCLEPCTSIKYNCDRATRKILMDQCSSTYEQVKLPHPGTLQNKERAACREACLTAASQFIGNIADMARPLIEAHQVSCIENSRIRPRLDALQKMRIDMTWDLSAVSSDSDFFLLKSTKFSSVPNKVVTIDPSDPTQLIGERFTSFIPEQSWEFISAPEDPMKPQFAKFWIVSHPGSLYPGRALCTAMNEEGHPIVTTQPFITRGPECMWIVEIMEEQKSEMFFVMADEGQPGRFGGLSLYMERGLNDPAVDGEAGYFIPPPPEDPSTMPPLTPEAVAEMQQHMPEKRKPVTGPGRPHHTASEGDRTQTPPLRRTLNKLNGNADKFEVGNSVGRATGSPLGEFVVAAKRKIEERKQASPRPPSHEPAAERETSADNEPNREREAERVESVPREPSHELAAERARIVHDQLGIRLRPPSHREPTASSPAVPKPPTTKSGSANPDDVPTSTRLRGPPKAQKHDEL